MGFLSIFKKKKETNFDKDSGLGEEEFGGNSFESDPLMDPNSGLNLPREEKPEESFSNPYLTSQNQQAPSAFQRYQEHNASAQQNISQNQNTQNDQKDMQIIIAKLDALRAEVQSLNHKIENLENKQKKKMWWFYLKKSNLLLVALFVVLLAFDQITKTIFSKQTIDLGLMALRPVTNTGMSFGLFQGNNTVFIFISAIFIALLIFFRKEFDNKALLVLILAGAVGNLVDRILHGHVLDFIDFKFFPVFNIADSLIFIGVVGIIFLEIKEIILKKNQAAKAKNIKN